MRASPRASSNPDPNPEGVPGRPTTPGTPSAPLPSLQGPPRHSPLSGALRAFQAHIKPSSSPLLDLSLTTELRPPSQASASDIKNRPRHPVPKSELRKGTTPKTNRESAPGLYGRREVLSAGKDAQPEPKADTRAHGERRYPRDSETPEGGTLRLRNRRERHQKPAMAPDNEPRAHQANREKAPLPNESRKCTDASTDVETVPSTEKDAQPEPKADTGAHGALRYPRDFETAENGSRRLPQETTSKTRHGTASKSEPLGRSEKRHHPEANRESAPKPLRPSRPCPRWGGTRSPAQGRYGRTRGAEIPTRF